MIIAWLYSVDKFWFINIFIYILFDLIINYVFISTYRNRYCVNKFWFINLIVYILIMYLLVPTEIDIRSLPTERLGIMCSDKKCLKTWRAVSIHGGTRHQYMKSYVSSRRVK